MTEVALLVQLANLLRSGQKLVHLRGGVSKCQRVAQLGLGDDEALAPKLLNQPVVPKIVGVQRLPDILCQFLPLPVRLREVQFVNMKSTIRSFLPICTITGGVFRRCFTITLSSFAIGQR